MRTAYEARHRLLIESLTKRFADELQIISSSVGLHIAARARKRSAAEILAIVKRASELGVECIPLSIYAVGASQPSGLLLGYGAIKREQIEPGLAVLRRAFDSQT
jgi:GntR family transcriptional regulator / MocR family aminotransferase